jgi:hypothetical protein
MPLRHLCRRRNAVRCGVQHGTGGDNSNGSGGTFFEGAMTIGCPSDTVEDSVAANIVAAGYGRTTTSIRFDVRNVATESPFKVNFNTSSRNATISYALQGTRRVSMNIVDQRGRQVASIVDGVMLAGRHEAAWNAKRVPAGVYVCRVSIDGMEEWAGKIMVGK